MIMIHAQAFLALLLASGTEPAMTEDRQALRLDVHQHEGAIEVQLIGNSAQAQEVRYLLEVTGQSTTRHRGKTTLSPNTTAVLSTVRANTGSSWCVKLFAEEEGRAPYEVTHGSCSSPPG